MKRERQVWVGSGQAKDSNGGWWHECWVYPNWVIPVGAKSAVLGQLDGIGAVRET